MMNNFKALCRIFFKPRESWEIFSKNRVNISKTYISIVVFLSLGQNLILYFAAEKWNNSTLSLFWIAIMGCALSFVFLFWVLPYAMHIVSDAFKKPITVQDARGFLAVIFIPRVVLLIASAICIGLLGIVEINIVKGFGILFSIASISYALLKIYVFCLGVYILSKLMDIKLVASILFSFNVLFVILIMGFIFAVVVVAYYPSE